MSYRAHARYLVAFVALTSACAVDARDLSLVGDPAEDPDWEERRARMAIVLQSDDGTSHTINQDQVQDRLGLYCQSAVRRLAAVQFEQCSYQPVQSMKRDPTRPPPMAEAEDCTERLCQSQIASCLALTMREIAESPAPVDLTVVETVYRFPPQSTEAKAALAERAFHLAQQAVVLSGELLRDVGVSPNQTCSDGVFLKSISTEDRSSSETLLEAAANTLVEMTHLAESSATAAAQYNVAVADSDRTRLGNTGAGSRAAWTAPVLSRLHAAQLIAGGIGHPVFDLDRTELGQYALTPNTGVCPQARCVGACARARDLFSSSGIDFRVLTDVRHFDVSGGVRVERAGVPLHDVLSGTGGAAGRGGVQARLAERLTMPELGTMSSDSFLRHVGLSETDMDSARTYMAQEARAFDRSIKDQEAIRPVIPGRGTSSFPYSTLTSRTPSVPPSAFQLSLARGAAAAEDDRPGKTPGQYDHAIPTADYALRSLAHTLDYAQSVSRQIFSSNGLGAEHHANIDDILGTIVMQGIAGRSGRLETCYRNSSDVGHRVRVRVYQEGDDAKSLQLVTGSAGAQCAATGRVDGQRCNLADYLVSGDVQTGTLSAASSAGYERFTEVTAPVNPGDVPVRWYAIRLLPGASRESAGAYEVLGEVVIPNTTTEVADEHVWCHANPIEPVIEQIAAAALTPRSDACGEPANDCFGAPLSGQLPLEDELIEDGDAFETSWRHHLNVAREAARRADDLGEQLLSSGMELDRRAEDALESVASFCGVDINLDGLFGAGGVQRVDLSRVVEGTCSTGEECSDQRYQCVHGRCVMDLVDAASLGPSDVRRLAECLGDESTVLDTVALGDRELCFWRTTGSDEICAPGGRVGLSRAPMACPYPKSAAGCGWTEGGEQVFPPAGTQLVTTSESLGLFRVGAAREDAGTGAPAVEPLDCSILRRIRTSAVPAGGRNIEEVIQTNFFHISNVKEWAERIGWRGYPLSFSMLTLDGAPWYGTGIPFDELSEPNPAGPFQVDVDGDPATRDAVSVWPCAERYRDIGLVRPPSCDPSDLTSLFCQEINCQDPIARARFNDRLGRAALALAITSGVGVGAFSFPVRYHVGADFPRARVQGLRVWDDYRDGVFNWQVADFVQWGPDGDDGFSGLAAWMISEDPTPGPREPLDYIWIHPRVAGSLSYEVGDGLQGGGRDELPVAFATLGDLNSDAAGEFAHKLWSAMSEGSLPESHSTYNDRCGFSRSFRIDYFAQALRGQGVRESDRLLNGHEAYESSPCQLNGDDLSDYWEDPGHHIRKNDDLNVSVNEVQLAPDGLYARDFLDGLELMCEAARYATEVDNCDPSRAPQIETAADIPQLRAYINCLANRIERSGERLVIQQVPQRVAALIRQEPSAQQLEAGLYGDSIIKLRQAFNAMGQLPSELASALRGFSSDLEHLELAFAGIKASGELQQLNAAGNMAGAASACAGSMSSPLGAAAACANAAAQIAIQLRVNDVEEALRDNSRRERFIEFRDAWFARQDDLDRISDEIDSAVLTIEGELLALRNGRRAASRAMARALFADSDAAGTHFHLNTVMRRTYNTRLARYRQAHQSAVQLAVLARRAIEQRLGVRMEEMNDDMQFVEAPRTWVNSVCESTGIDYARIRNQTPLLNDAGEEVDNFADAYIGDYIDRLDRFVESYRIDYPASSGSDVAVISVRDDIMHVVAECSEIPSANLLAMSNDLRAAFVPPERAEGGEVIESELVGAWEPLHCAAAPGEAANGCVSVVPTALGPADVGLGPAGIRPIIGASRRDEPRAFRVTFGEGPDYRDNAELQQQVALRSGVYRLSWYGRTGNVGAITPDQAVSLVSDSGGVETSPTFVVRDATVAGGWTRFTRFYRVGSGREGRVRVSSGLAPETAENWVVLAGVQLEFIGDRIASMPATQDAFDDTAVRFHPSPFSATTYPGIARGRGCEDSDGSEFRQEWAYRCERLCDGGVEVCREGESPTWWCFWSVRFPLNIASLNRGAALENVGFAAGNFNYRIEHLAVNFVGTGTRICDDPRNPSTCYSAANLPYSIYHRPPYTVIDYDGNDYDAPLFEGRIERARGLARETYVTSPPSASDDAVLSRPEYRRTDLRGRPLSGMFELRVWDTPGVNFTGIEDVQLVLGYRYFTRTPRP